MSAGPWCDLCGCLMELDRYRCEACWIEHGDEDPKPDAVIRLVDRSDDAAHWSPEDALADALARLRELGGSTLIAAFVDDEGAIQIVRCGDEARIVLLAQKLASHELETVDLSALKGAT